MSKLKRTFLTTFGIATAVIAVLFYVRYATPIDQRSLSFSNANAAGNNSWFSSFNPLREFYVSSAGIAGTAYDYSTTHSNSTVLGNINLTAGKVSNGGTVGDAVEFGNGSGSYLGLAQPVSFGTNSSVSGWIKTTGTGIGYIIGKGGSGIGSGGNIFGTKNGKLYLLLDERGNNQQAGCGDQTLAFSSPSSINDGNWHFAAVTYNQGTKIAIIYLDGQEIGQVNFSTMNNACIPSWDYIGGSPVDEWPSANLNGALDELRIYNRVLSSAEILAQYSGNNQYGSINESGLTIGFHFDNGINPGSQSNPYSAAAAASIANPGDLFWFMPGSYSMGKLTLTRNGTAANPIVYRAMPNARVAISGYFNVNSDYTWIWGMELTGLDDINNTNGNNIALNRIGGRAINNIIHDGVGMSIWNSPGVGPGQIAYGNIIYEGNQYTFQKRGHNIYAQNNYSAHGYQYIVNNMLLEPPRQSCGLIQDGNGVVISASDCFSFHAYTQGNQVSGLWIEKNIIGPGRFLLGATQGTNENNIIKDNFFNTSPQTGYASGAIQVEILDNYIVNGSLGNNFFWVNGSLPNKVTGNQVYMTYQGGRVIDQLYTCTDGGSSNCQGTAPISSNTVWDNNTYGPSFGADQLKANGVLKIQMNSLSAWQQATLAAGKQFDANSQVVPLPTTNKVILIPNEYEPNRASLAVYNWENSSTAMVDLSNFAQINSSYQVVAARNFYGPPIASGTFSGSPISVPVSNGLNAFVVKVGAVSASDTVPPVMSGGLPSGTQPVGTTSINMTLTTNEIATCKYGTVPNVPYSSMTTVFSTTNSTSHSKPLTGLTNGTSYNYYIRCQDTAGNANTADYAINFGVANSQPVPTINSFSASPNSILPGSSSTLSWSVTGATSISLNQGIGNVSGTSKSVSPASTTVYTLTATNSGGYSTSTVTVIVSPAPDTLPPTVNITSPAMSSTVSGTAVLLSANASDNIRVSGIQFKLDGSNLGAEDTTYPYEFTWNTTTMSNGIHILTAVAKDDSNNSAASPPVNVNVNNEIVAGTVSTPYINPNGGSFSAGQMVTISTATNAAVIRYTMNSSDPTLTNGTIYTSPFIIDATATVKAIAYTSSLVVSPVASATFTINSGTTGGGPTSPPPPLPPSIPNKGLVNSNGTYFLVEGGFRKGITTPGILYSCGYEFKDARAAIASDLELPTDFLLPCGGALVKSITDQTVYLISNGKRYAFTSNDVFTGLGFKSSSILLITDPELQAIPKASNLSNPSAAHLPGIDINDRGTIYWIAEDRSKHPYQSIDVWNSWHKDGDFSIVVPANSADLSLPIVNFVIPRSY